VTNNYLFYQESGDIYRGDLQLRQPPTISQVLLYIPVSAHISGFRLLVNIWWYLCQ
jgi:hypothetical protein